MSREILKPLVNRYYERYLDPKPSLTAEDVEYQLWLPEIRKLYSQASYWHGTGRYEYDQNGMVSDRLVGILKNGGLIPHKDDWDQKNGVIQSISLALPRMYGRLYASIHNPNGTTTKNELGSRTLWGYYFFGTSFLRGLLEYPPSLGLIFTFNYWRIGESVIPNYPSKLIHWGKKISKNPESFYNLFSKGTDIEKNYPILIGIKSNALNCHPTSKFIELFERRTTDSITPEQITHLEIPLEYFSETRDLLDNYGWNDMTLIPLEWGDEYCRRFSFTDLVSDKPLISSSHVLH